MSRVMAEFSSVEMASEKDLEINSQLWIGVGVGGGGIPDQEYSDRPGDLCKTAGGVMPVPSPFARPMEPWRYAHRLLSFGFTAGFWL